MSRIGKKEIQIPKEVSLGISDNTISIKGPGGQLHFQFSPKLYLKHEDNALMVLPVSKEKNYSAIWGTTAAHIRNMIEGVVNGFKKQLIIEGIGYKAIVKGSDLEFSLGFSHPVIYKAKEGITFKVEKNVVTIEGIDKQKVGQVAAEIRNLKKPEPYKGKGIRYIDEVVRRKSGKKTVAAAG